MPGKYLARGMLERPGRRFLTSWKNCWSYHDSWERNRNIFGYIHYHLKQILSGITLLKDRKDSNFLHSPGGCRHMAGLELSQVRYVTFLLVITINLGEARGSITSPHQDAGQTSGRTGSPHLFLLVSWEPLWEAVDPRDQGESLSVQTISW